MRALYFVIQFLPYWAIPLGLIFFEVGFVLKKRGNQHLFYRLIAISSFLFILTACFFIFRWESTAFPFLRDHLAPQ